MPQPRLVAAAAAGLLACALLPATGPAAARAVDAEGVVAETPLLGTPHVMNGAVLDVAQIGDRVFVVGTFSRVSPADTFHAPRDDLRRRGIFAFDLDTGAIDRRFTPRLDGSAYTIEAVGRRLVVGGDFTRAGGHAARHLVKLTARGSVVGAFRASTDLPVTDVAVRGTRVYIAGAFRSVRHGRRPTGPGALAAVHVRSGRVLPALRLRFSGVYDPARGGRTDVRRIDVTADGRRLVAVGNFARVAGRSRPQVVVLDTSGPRARVTRWRTPRYGRSHSDCGPGIDSFVRDVALAPTGRAFVVTTAGAFRGGARTRTLCDTVAAWRTAGGRSPIWLAYTGGDSTMGVAVTSEAVYVGGHMRWFNNPYGNQVRGPGAVPRSGIAALDPRNGLPLSWDPGRQRGYGAQALLVTRDGLWVGSDTTLFAAQRRGRIALLPHAGGRPVPETGPAVLPGDLFIVRRNALVRRPLGARGAPTGRGSVVDRDRSWSGVRGAFLVAETLYLGRRDGTLQRRRFDPETGDLGPTRRVNLHDARDGTRIRFPLGRLTGMFFAPGTHRLYYTVRKDPHLYHRAFTPESRVVGAQFATAPRSRVDLRGVAGLTLAGGRVIFGSRDGTLRSARFAGGRIVGRPRVLDRDGSWRARGLAVPTR